MAGRVVPINMDAAFSDQIRNFARDFAEKEIGYELADVLDREDKYPLDLVRRMGKLGLIGVSFPLEYGGAGLGALPWVMVEEEVSRVSAGVGLILDVQGGLATDTILTFGSEKQKQNYLPGLLSGGIIGAFGLTESHAGSDTAGMRTKAVLKGNEWVLNGEKIFITQGAVADVVTVFANTGVRKKDGRPLISAFIVENGTPGFTAKKMPRMLGHHASITSDLIFEDCRIPKENLIGEEGKAMTYFLSTLDRGRLSISGIALGVHQAALEAAIHYTGKTPKDAKEFSMQELIYYGQAIPTQGKEFTVADIATELAASRALVYQAAQAYDIGSPDKTMKAAMAKLYSSEAAFRAANFAVNIKGEENEDPRYPADRLLRDAKLLKIGEGTSQIQKLVIARELLK
ncbi:MAG: acyl-CoA dehydrogenase family protein [Candidatus Altiarchaeota archaeon]